MYSANALITFDMVFDVDLALLKLIRERYLDEEEFNFELITQTNPILHQLLRSRPNVNPLIGFVNNVEDTDPYYFKFIGEKYGEILEFAEPTALFDLVSKFMISRGMVIPTIAYFDERELELLKKFNRFGKINTLYVEDFKDINLDKFDVIYIKDYIKVLSFDQQKFVGKTVYISSNMYNMTFNLSNEPIPNVDITVLCMDSNEINVIDMYEEDDYMDYEEPDPDYYEDPEDYDPEDFPEDYIEEGDLDNE